MNTNYTTLKKLAIALVFLLSVSSISMAQDCEWRLETPTFTSVDPDGAGPALGSATFTLQVRTRVGSIPNVTAISVGYSYQSANAMIPTTPGCSIVSGPANVTISPAFAAGGFAYTTVNQCGDFAQNTGGQNFDKRAVGTMDAVSGSGVTLTTAWTDVFTVTLWTLSNSNPQGGYVIINSGAGGNPGEFNTYAISDASFNEYIAYSLTYVTPLPLGTTAPVTFTSFAAKCSGNGTLISWSTAQELNSDYFEVQRSTDGNIWKSIGRTPGAGISNGSRTYSQLDLEAGNAMYRIKQVDKNGQVTYTNIERANCDVKSISAVLYPVPAKDVLNVVIKSDKALNAQLVIMDITGKLVRKLETNLQNGTNNFRFDLTGLSSGEYILRSTDPSLELNKKFTIVR
ncbi:MAG: T9SS type A sorting domain-containing protein [Ferruginibacter sp.]